MVTSPEKVEMDSHQTCGAGQKSKICGRDERMAKQKIQCQNLMFLTSNKNPEGMTKNEIGMLEIKLKLTCGMLNVSNIFTKRYEL